MAQRNSGGEEITWREQLPNLFRYLDQYEATGGEPVFPCDAATLARWNREAVFGAIADFLEQRVPPSRHIQDRDELRALFEELAPAAERGPAKVDARWLAKDESGGTLLIELCGPQLRVRVKNEFGENDELRTLDSPEEARALAEQMTRELPPEFKLVK